MKSNAAPQQLSAINQALEQIFDAETQKAATIHPAYERLWQHMHTTALRGGKRLRPRLLLEIAGQSDADTLKIAVAHELLHIGMLIHDDIIDSDDIRHGAKNLVGIYKEIYADAKDRVDTEHFARSAALVAGNLLLSSAHRLVAASDFSPRLVQQLQELLYRSVFEVIGGQLMDTEAPFMSEYYDPLTVYKYKTASYSFVGPILSGAAIAGMDSSTTAALERYGEALGVAFQLRDDDLGVFGDSSITGKSTSQDLKEGKKTKLIELFKERSNETEQAAFMATFGSRTASDESIESMRELLITTGARQAHDTLTRHYLQQALEAISAIPEPLHGWLTDFAHKNAERTL